MNAKKRMIAWASSLALIALVLSACGLAAPAEPTQDPNMIFTQVAETVMVSMTQTSEAMPPTPTPEPSPTAEPTLPPFPTVDPNIPTPTPFQQIPAGPTATIQRYGDVAKFNTQSPADGKVFKVGEDFAFHVCLGNIGSTDWDTEYYLEWVSGNRLWSNTKYFYVGKVVKPGGKWCFDLPSVAPWSPGSYITRWYFKNPDNQFILEVYFSYKVEP
ncbi:MAG TPA: NBR1-Ig-like domain-containing protein [Pelolinea sp.]|nr:NBR1-Ig-like domain-containing protein [Pelolinea sp.]